MNAVVDITEGRSRTVAGRKDGEKQEQIIETGEIRSRASHLLDLHHRAKTASVEYSEAIKAAAEASGLNASTVRSYIAAVASEQFKDRARKAQQLALVFDELGENPAQALLTAS